MKSLKSICATAVVILAATGAQAQNVAVGNYWHVPEAVSQNAILANVPATTPDLIFSVNSPFNFSGTSVTVGTWLASSAAFNIVENTPGTLASLMDNFTVGSLLYFTGQVSVTNGQMFTVTHDDGLTLIIGGLDLGFSPLPTPPITSIATYTGPHRDVRFRARLHRVLRRARGVAGRPAVHGRGSGAGDVCVDARRPRRARLRRASPPSRLSTAFSSFSCAAPASPGPCRFRSLIVA
jgi:hypothetical protein